MDASCRGRIITMRSLQRGLVFPVKLVRRVLTVLTIGEALEKLSAKQRESTRAGHPGLQKPDISGFD
jgi:hypothetical protein